MKRKLMSVKLLVFMVGFVVSYTLTCGAQSLGNREDEEAIKQVIAGTTEAFTNTLMLNSRCGGN